LNVTATGWIVTMSLGCWRNPGTIGTYHVTDPGATVMEI
jgi:hypothetical protein